MVLFFTSKAVDPPVTIYIKLSSAHVYLRQSEGEPHGEWDALPTALVNDAAQLVKANSIEGNKKDNITIIYTPFTNLKVSFHNDKIVKRVKINTRDNAIVNRLNKTKAEREVDHEAERQERLRQEGRKKKADAVERKRQEEEQKRVYAEQKAQRSYDGMFTEDAIDNAKDDWSDDDFM